MRNLFLENNRGSKERSHDDGIFTVSMAISYVYIFYLWKKNFFYLYRIFVTILWKLGSDFMLMMTAFKKNVKKAEEGKKFRKKFKV